MIERPLGLVLGFPVRREGCERCIVLRTCGMAVEEDGSREPADSVTRCQDRLTASRSGRRRRRGEKEETR